ncbi:MAG: copper chaperone PCu(A)C [Colwellia sp.]|nr:copper chaperone PCu(A)C [Colwellia sp.]
MALARILVTLSILLLSNLINAHSNEDKTITFSTPWIRLLPPTVMHTAAYVTIDNSSNKPDTLLNVTSTVVNSLSVHQTKNVDGMMKMLSADNLQIPAHGKITLAPGGYHIMLMGLESSLVENQEITMTFEFKNAGEIEVVFPVVKR